MAPFFPQQMNAGLQQVGQTPSSYLTSGLARGVSEYNSYERGPSATPMASVLGPLYPSYVQSSSQNLGVSNQLDPYGNTQRIQTPVGTQRGSQVYPSQYPYPPPYSSWLISDLMTELIFLCWEIFLWVILIGPRKDCHMYKVNDYDHLKWDRHI